MAKLVFFALLALSVALSEGKVFSSDCELVRELRKHGFPENKMADWACLIKAESSRDTGKVSKPNRNKSVDYGLFQINDKYWCSNTGTAGKDCHVTCRELITDDITKASQCAHKIFKRHGFNAWYGWKNKCQGALPDVSKC
uniref:Lysozyme n=1 Tax=Plutella xylostella TaxID=51655 RepID=A0A0A7DPR2_PLUXY|nr:Lysozyme II [Plutella xylostella]